jgi:hypothetical protein
MIILYVLAIHNENQGHESGDFYFYFIFLFLATTIRAKRMRNVRDLEPN